MAIPVPDAARLAELSRRYGFDLTQAEIGEFVPAVEGTLAASEEVERLYERSSPEVPVRESSLPVDNPLNAWSVRTAITETAEGPLAGRTVAVKDNIAVAGVPMVNGSASMEGFVPRRDATVVRRLLAAGATIAGKSTSITCVQ